MTRTGVLQMNFRDRPPTRDGGIGREFAVGAARRRTGPWWWVVLWCSGGPVIAGTPPLRARSGADGPVVPRGEVRGSRRASECTQVRPRCPHGATMERGRGAQKNVVE